MEETGLRIGKEVGFCSDYEELIVIKGRSYGGVPLCRSLIKGAMSHKIM